MIKLRDPAHEESTVLWDAPRCTSSKKKDISGIYSFHFISFHSLTAFHIPRGLSKPWFVYTTTRHYNKGERVMIFRAVWVPFTPARHSVHTDSLLEQPPARAWSFKRPARARSCIWSRHQATKNKPWTRGGENRGGLKPKTNPHQQRTHERSSVALFESGNELEPT